LPSNATDNSDDFLYHYNYDENSPNAQKSKEDHRAESTLSLLEHGRAYSTVCIFASLA